MEDVGFDDLRCWSKGLPLNSCGLGAENVFETANDDAKEGLRGKKFGPGSQLSRRGRGHCRMLVPERNSTPEQTKSHE
jgi:hypothetical protein